MNSLLTDTQFPTGEDKMECLVCKEKTHDTICNDCYKKMDLTAKIKHVKAILEDLKKQQKWEQFMSTRFVK